MSTNELKVRAGSTFRHFGGKVFDADDIFIHPLYNVSSYLDYDFAIIHLETTPEFPHSAQIISLPDENDEPIEGEMTLVTGWGETNNVFESPGILRAVDIPIISREPCRKQWSSEDITDQMICGGYPEGGKAFTLTN